MGARRTQSTTSWLQFPASASPASRRAPVQSRSHRARVAELMNYTHYVIHVVAVVRAFHDRTLLEQRAESPTLQRAVSRAC
jgi:hypothetical protein